jgi:threonine dehydrogenase-like Zn-dependent dehydrogenase
MRAVTFEGLGKMEYKIVSKPNIIDTTDVIIRMTACTLCCKCDLHAYVGDIVPQRGTIMGHEAMGIVEDKGCEVRDFSIGDRVVVANCIACGMCDACKRQEYLGCRVTNGQLLAESGKLCFDGNQGSGSQAEYIRVPFADVNCFKVPDDVPDEKALYLSDVACTSLHAVEMGEVKEGDTVVIWGLGPIGLCAAKWCKLRGARRVIGIDSVPNRLELAEGTVGIEVLNRGGMSSRDVVSNLQAIVPGGADVCIEAVGFRFDLFITHSQDKHSCCKTPPDILYSCFKIVRPFGRVSIVGDYVGEIDNFPIGLIAAKHLTIRAGICPIQKYIAYVMTKVQDGSFDPSFIISHRVNLHSVPSVYSKLNELESGYIKIFVRP